MKTIIQIGPAHVRATFENCRWSCDDPDLSDIIQMILDGVENSPSIPDWDHHRARLVCDFLSGEIVAYSGPPKVVPGRVY